MKSLVILSLVFELTVGQTFNRANVGVAFSPYTQNWVGGSTGYWNIYTVEDIKDMLRVVNSKFNSIATYGMGVADYNQNNPWDKADSNCLVARAAAQLNVGNPNKILVSQGIAQIPNDSIQEKEIQNALAAAKDANSISAGTVWSLTFTNEYFTSADTGNRILNMITSHKTAAHQQNLKVGTRINNCWQIYQSGPMTDILVNILKNSDFIMCNVYPDVNNVNSGTQQGANAVIGEFSGYVTAFQKVNPTIQVIIGETGWPSQGISFNKSPNSVANLKSFWAQINTLAAQKGYLVHMFEAIDEPWKSNQKSTDQNAVDGPNGGEGHYGWWKRIEGNPKPQYVEK